MGLSQRALLQSALRQPAYLSGLACEANTEKDLALSQKYSSPLVHMDCQLFSRLERLFLVLPGYARNMIRDLLSATKACTPPVALP